MNTEEHEDDDDYTWLCHLCDQEEDFDTLPGGYISNNHPLCYRCSDQLLEDPDSRHYCRLTYHYELGDLVHIGGLVFPENSKN